MSARGRKPPSNGYEVGYGKPPVRTRFRTGQSGNPGGRPRGMTAGRANALVLKEAYRLVRLREGETVIELPALQAILRAQVAGAAKGSGPAQRAVIEAVQTIEREIAAQTTAERAEKAAEPMSDLEVARRIAFILTRGIHELEHKNAATLTSKK